MPAAPLHIVIILAPLLASPLAGWLWHRRSGALLLAATPAALTAYFAYVFSVVSRNGPVSVTGTWAPALNLSLSFRFDGLSALFALLITGVGTLIVIYAGKYLEHHPYAARFHVSAVRVHGLDARPGPQRQRHRPVRVLGAHRVHVVSADRVRARTAGGSARGHSGAAGDRGRGPRAARGRSASRARSGHSAAVRAGGRVPLTDSPLYVAIVALVLLAAFTKSAQFPFHFWLPNAMQAPTPVSAYLHSATMVKAGVYLVARMTPLLGGTADVDGHDHGRRHADDGSARSAPCSKRTSSACSPIRR